MRDIIFKSIFFFGALFICILFLPSLLMPKKIVLFGGKLLGYWSSICLKAFYSTKIVIKRKENIIMDTNFFIACSHQSMFETFYLQTVFNSPIFILKRELLNIPIFGWYLKKIDSISIRRNKVAKDNLNFIEKIKLIMEKTKRPVIIFPQATRVAPNEIVPFKKGVGRIYKALNLPCIPVALNTGKVWPKNSFMKYPGDIHISFLKPIMSGKDNEEFTRDIENQIYNEIRKFS